MWNGFFDLNGITELEDLKSFYREALSVSTSAHVDILVGARRQRHPTITPEEYIENYITLRTHNVAIDRYLYNHFADWARQEGEIGSCTIDLFIFIYIELNKFYDIIEKWKLPKKIY